MICDSSSIVSATSPSKDGKLLRWSNSKTSTRNPPGVVPGGHSDGGEGEGEGEGEGGGGEGEGEGEGGGGEGEGDGEGDGELPRALHFFGPQMSTLSARAQHQLQLFCTAFLPLTALH